MPYLWLGGDSWERQAGDDDNRALVSLDWTPSLQVNEAPGNSDKTITVPADTEWRVRWIWLEFTTAGGGGNRQLEIQIQDDAADVIAEIKVGIVQAGGATRFYMLSPHLADLAAFRDTDWLMTPMPEWILPEGYIIHIWDNTGVGTDDLIIQMMVLARTVT